MGGRTREEEARSSRTHRASRASAEGTRRPERSGGEGRGGGAARAPICKCQLRSAAGPQPRRKRKSLRLPPLHPPARPFPGGSRVSEPEVCPRHAVKEHRASSVRLSAPVAPRGPPSRLPPSAPARGPASRPAKPLLLPPPPFSNLQFGLQASLDYG